MNLTLDAERLLEEWKRLRLAEPHLRARDAASRLGVSEAQLVAAGPFDRVLSLRTDWPGLITACRSLGRVMCLTRNESAVHERHGEFLDVAFFEGMGQVLGPDIDLRLFPRAWAHAFGVYEETPRGPRRSLQIFDTHGTAVLKVYATRPEAVVAFETLAASFEKADGSDAMVIVPVPARPADRPDADIDLAVFRSEWDALEDTHDFIHLLRRHGLARRQALRLAGDTRARAVDPARFDATLLAAVEQALPIMIFVGNRGAIQIHSGPIHRIVDQGGWLNILDPDFNLHLRRVDVDSAWIVTKPTRDGIVTSLELFDAAGDNILMMFGERKPGRAELAGWRGLMAG